MNFILQLCQRLEDTAVATAIREQESLFPWIESVHVLAITLVVGTILIVDLRLLGLGSRQRPVSRVLAEVLPFTRAAFVLAALTGATLFASHAVKYAGNFPFQMKMGLLGFALINILVFHTRGIRDIERWDVTARTSPAARAAGGISLLCWIVVVGAGRWIGFT